MLPLLASAEREAGTISSTTRRTAAKLQTIIGRTVTASEVLRVIAREQKRSATSASLTNDFLRRVLVALKKTNRSFPPA
jgi:hypothetical protein